MGTSQIGEGAQQFYKVEQGGIQAEVAVQRLMEKHEMELGGVQGERGWRELQQLLTQVKKH